MVHFSLQMLKTKTLKNVLSLFIFQKLHYDQMSSCRKEWVGRHRKWQYSSSMIRRNECGSKLKIPTPSLLFCNTFAMKINPQADLYWNSPLNWNRLFVFRKRSGEPYSHLFTSLKNRFFMCDFQLRYTQCFRENLMRTMKLRMSDILCVISVKCSSALVEGFIIHTYWVGYRL